MAYQQLRDADMNIGYTGGWCLKYVQDAYGTDHPYPTALAAWDAEPVATSHGEYPPLGITVPIYFSLGNEPAGHVAIRLDDGWVASSTLSGYNARPYLHPSIDDLINVYGRYNGGCTYLGWGEHVGSVRVVEATANNATDDQIRQAYRDILERDAEPDALTHYRAYTIDFVRSDLMNSQEKRDLDARKAQAQADAAAQAVAAARAQADAAKKAAEQKAAAEAAQKAAEQAKAAQAELDRVAAEQAAVKAAEDAKAAQLAAQGTNVYVVDQETKQNISRILAIVLSIKMMLVNFIGYVKTKLGK